MPNVYVPFLAPKRGRFHENGENDEFALILPTENKGFAPQTLENDEDDENGGYHSGEGMVSSLRQKFLKSFQGIGPHRYSLKKKRKGLVHTSVIEIQMDQWLPNLCESSGLHRYRSIECSSLSGKLAFVINKV